MDEILDLLDGLEAVASIEELANASVDLGELAIALGVADFDPDLAGVFLEDPYDVFERIAPPDGSGVGSPGASGWSDWSDRVSAELPNGETLEMIVPTPENAHEFLAEAQGSYLPGLLQGLSNVRLESGDLGENVMGCWTFTANGAEITLDPTHGDFWATANHELGHHIFETNPSLKEPLLSLLSEEGFADDQWAFLSAYDPAVRPAEACAEALAQYRSNALAFTYQYPKAAAFLDQLIVPGSL